MFSVHLSNFFMVYIAPDVPCLISVIFIMIVLVLKIIGSVNGWLYTKFLDRTGVISSRDSMALLQ